MCDCALCKTIREEFDVQEGEEHLVLCRIVESHRRFARTLHEVDGKMSECHQTIKQHGLSSDDIYRGREINGMLLEQTFRRHEGAEELMEDAGKDEFETESE